MTNQNEKQKYVLTTLGKYMMVLSTLLIVTTALSMGIGYSYSLSAGVEVRNVFKDPLLLAENTWSADTAIEYVQVAIDGIEALGLEPTDYNTYFSWGKTFSNSIENTYAEMHSSIEVLEDIIRWREKQYDTTQMTGEIIEDLYHDKMYNYHESVNTVEDWFDDVDSSYALKNGYVVYYFNGYTKLVNLILLVGVCVCLLVRIMSWDEEFRKEVY